MVPQKAIERREVKIEEARHRFPIGNFVSIVIGASTKYAKVVDIRDSFEPEDSRHEPIRSSVILLIKEYSVDGFSMFNNDVRLTDAIISPVPKEDMVRYFTNFVTNEIIRSENKIADAQNTISAERRKIKRLKERAKLLDKELI